MTAPTVCLRRINLFRPRALPAGSAALTALASVRAYYLRGWASRTTRFLGLSCPNSQLAAPAPLSRAARSTQCQCAGAAPEQPLLRAPLPLIHCSPARAGVAQVPGRWQGVSGADVDLLIVPLSASARVTAGVGGVTWRSGRLTQG